MEPAVKPNQAQVLGALILAGLVALFLLLRHWKFSG
jgi:hypothetical protein